MNAPQNMPAAPIPVMHANIVVPSSNSPPAVMEENAVEQVEEPRPAYVEAVEPESEQQEFAVEPVSNSNEPKTYANLFKSNAFSPTAPQAVTPPQAQPIQQQAVAPVAPQAFQAKPASPTFNQPGRNMNRNNRNGPQNARAPRQDGRMLGGRTEDGGKNPRYKCM